MSDSVNQPTVRNSLQPGDCLKLWWPVILIVVLFVVGQWPVFKNWWGVWNEKEGYYSHGFLVPFIAAFMLWTNRGKLARAEIRPSWIGLILLLIFLPVQAIGLMMGLRALYGVAFFLCVFGAALLVFGRHITRIVSIPILFLVTMIPLASSVLDTLTFRAQLVSSTVATKFLQLIFWGSDITQRGNQICSSEIPGGVLLVGSPCSGLRLLISLITFTWFFTYVIRGAWWKKAILLGMSLPLTIFINSLRVTLIGCVGSWTESADAMHAFHDYSGYIGLVICFVILFGIAKLLKMGDLYAGEPAEFPGMTRKQRRGPIGGGLAGVVVIALLAIGAALSGTVKPLYDLPKGHINKSGIPQSFSNWVGQDLPIDTYSKQVLGKGDLLSRMYTDANATGRQVQVFMDASLDTSAFHDPHLCLPGGGSPITQDRFITISFTKPRPITVRATMIEATSDYGSSLLIYWYMLKDKSFPTTNDAFDMNLRNKQDDLNRLVMSPWQTSKLRRDILSRQFTWYRFSTEIVDKKTDRKFLSGFIRDFVASTKGFGE